MSATIQVQSLSTYFVWEGYDLDYLGCVFGSFDQLFSIRVFIYEFKRWSIT